MEGHLEHDGHRAWYRVVGELPSAPRAPVIICHGGPGATHDSCVLYDQLGNGRSDHLPDVDPSFWAVELFERELAARAAHLGIEERYHVVGQSWGGMLALLHALERPPGLLRARRGQAVGRRRHARAPAPRGAGALRGLQPRAPHRGARALPRGRGGVLGAD